MAIELRDNFAIHPGLWLREEVIKPYRMTVSVAADHLGVTRSVLSRVLNGNARLTPLMAIRFEQAFGISTEAMLRMQLSHDLVKAKLKASSISISRVLRPPE